MQRAAGAGGDQRRVGKGPSSWCRRDLSPPLVLRAAPAAPAASGHACRAPWPPTTPGLASRSGCDRLGSGADATARLLVGPDTPGKVRPDAVFARKVYNGKLTFADGNAVDYWACKDPSDDKPFPSTPIRLR